MENTTSPGKDNNYARALFDQLIGRVNEKDRFFETDEQIVNIGGRSLPSYGFVQCTRDLNVSSCRECLNDLMVEAEDCCESKIGWRISGPSCSLRYENYSLTASPPAPSPSPLPPSQSLPAAPQPKPDNVLLQLGFSGSIFPQVPREYSLTVNEDLSSFIASLADGSKVVK
ncbi:cysteine-rich repeat secretory protein 38-like [Quercus lobata]|uniref:cysteine-rich repeat secretory protein 38-like n=1 Tax=Quercus lobata TaxID=97700 RepID=UPI001247DBD3|nr:cysteine-rich repeat secretory protein 38-like [Quercus lobata]